MVFCYFPGCTLSTTAAKMDNYARLSARALGVTLEDIPEWECCGAVFPLGTDEIAPKLSVIRALLHAKKMNRALVTLCSACHHVFKQVNNQASNDADFRAAVVAYDSALDYAGDTQVLHFAEVLKLYIGFDNVKNKVVNPLSGRKIGAYYGCMLLRPGKIMQFDDPENPSILEDLIRALGAEAVPFPYRNECCGGYRALKDKNKTAKMSENVINSAIKKGVGEIVTACPLCEYNIRKSVGSENSDIPVLYLTEILAEALGVKGDGHV